MQHFSVEGIHQMFMGPFFGNLDKILLLGQAPEIWGNFSKIFIKIIKNLKNYLENLRKIKIFSNFFIFVTYVEENIRIIIDKDYNAGFGGGARLQRERKFQTL